MPLTPDTKHSRTLTNIDYQMRDFVARAPRPGLLATIRTIITNAVTRRQTRRTAARIAPANSPMRWWIVLDNPDFGWPEDVLAEARAAREAEMEAIAAELRLLDGR